MKKTLGQTGIELPPVVFGTSCLGNLYQVYSDETKLAILSEIFRFSPATVVLDSAGKYGAGLALEVIGRSLRALAIPPERVLISNKLGWRRAPLAGAEPTFEPGAWFGLDHDSVQDISYEGILRCFEEGQRLLGAPYRTRIASVHDPDEYCARPQDDAARRRVWDDILGAYQALHDLKRQSQVAAIGVGAKDWRVIQRLVDAVELDWVMLACSFTIYHHPPEVLALLESLHARRIGIINSAVFHAGFLTGGAFFDYRRLDEANPQDRPLFEWRQRFWAICEQYGVSPASACARFALSPPAVGAIALNTSKPEHVQRNVALASEDIPPAFWSALKAARLIRADYPHLGS